MGKFNLLEEPWISVMTDQKGSTKVVSISDLFAHAQEYRQLAGDMATQDFAVLRFLLAILHTVFSRFDASGEPYRFVELDERFRQLNDVDEDDLEDYEKALTDTWEDLWQMGKFPPVMNEYLSTWYDRFYLLDEQHPFYQVTRYDLSPDKISKEAPSSIAGKNINRLISESGNKLSLFSPRYSAKGNKDRLSAPEIARWILTFQGYTGLADKVIFGNQKYKASKGWLFDIGGVAAKGNNLYETLLLNCLLVHPEPRYLGYRQRPCWEYDSSDVVQRLLSSEAVTNLAELYTNWSRAIYMDPDLDPENNAGIEIVKLQEIEHRDNFLEPMTLWRFNSSGENKDKHTPQKHRINRSVWRTFGSLTLPNSSAKNEEQRMPGIMEWLSLRRKSVGNVSVTIEAISMQDDGNATSWVPVDEIFDTLNINNFVLTDIAQSGWIPRINEAVELTKNVVDRTYRKLMSDIREIRNLSSSDFVGIKAEELYFMIDGPFRSWLADLKPDDGKDEKIRLWKEILRNIVLEESEKVLSEAGPRDFTGIIKDGKTKNIATAFNSFLFFLNKQL